MTTTPPLVHPTDPIVLRDGDTPHSLCERGGHAWQAGVIMDESTRVVYRPCRRCPALAVVGTMCMCMQASGKPCEGWPTRWVARLGGVHLCKPHARMLGEEYVTRRWQ